METIDIGDARLECRRAGDGAANAPVLVFLHDGLGCVATWREVPERIAARLGLPAFIYSRAGYGGSDPVPLPRPLDYEHREALDVLPRVLAAAGIGRALLVGHSDGATMALIYAAEAEPMVAEALVAMAPHVFNEEISVAGIRRTLAEFETGDLRPRLTRHHGANTDCAFHGWADTWLDPHFRHWTIAGLLPRIRVPVLVIQGEDDDYGSLDQVTTIADRVSGPAETLVLPACGHLPHHEMPAETEDAIVRFLAGVISR